MSYLAQNALTGTYTIGGSYALQAKSLVLNMGEALVVGATSVNFTYNSAGTETQQLVAVSGATVTSPQFSGFGSIALSNFKLRADGFSFDSFTLSSTASPGIGNLLTASSITLNASNVDVSFGTSTTSASFSGTVTATISGLQLFPVGGFVQFQATAVTGSYGFGGFDGTSASGKLSLAITGFQLSMGEAFKIVATGTVTVTPGQTQIATIAAATLSSPQFSQLGSVSLTNLVLSQTGFSLADVSMTTGGSPAAMGDFLTFDSLSVSFKDFVFTYGSEVKVDGTVQVTPTNVILFPGISFLNLHLGDLTGTYNFGGSALLSIGIPNLDIVIGQALTIHLGHVTIQPSQSVMLHVTDATVTSNLFSGLETFKLGDFDLTQTGFTLGSFTLNALTGVTVSLGGFLEFGSVSVVVSNLTVDKTATPKISGTITTTIGNMTLFPGSSLITSSFGTVTASYDFSGSNSVGRLTFTTESFSLSIGSQLSITGSGLVITPDQDTIATLASATLTLVPLNNLTASLTNLAIQKNGFSIARATVTTADITLGGLFALTSPTLTFTNVSYTMGSSLSGTVAFDAGATLSLGAAIQTTSSHITASYNFQTKVFNASIEDFAVEVPGFVSISGSGVAVSYEPASDGTSKILVGAQDITVLMGSGSGNSAVGVQINNASLALAIYKAVDGSITYAVEATGGIALVGMPADTLSLSAKNVKVRVNNAGDVNELINVDSDPAHAVHLLYEANEQSLLVTGLTLTIGNFVTLTGNFGFQAFIDPITNLTDVAVGASEVNAVLGTSTTNLTITGASFGLLLRPGISGNPTTYALMANGGTNSLNGVPGLTLTASGLTVKVNTTGLDPETLAGLPQTILTPDGSLPFDFAGLGSGDIIRVEGSITLNIANFVSLKGDFAFQTFKDSNSGLNNILVAATNVDSVLGTSTTNLTISGASLGLAIISGTPSTYVLIVNGGTNTLNGVPGLELSASGLKVRVNTTGVDPTTLGIPATLSTPGGSVDLDFSDLGSGLVKDIQGALTLTVAGFVTLHGDFGFQSFTDSTTGLTNMAIGATNVDAVLGTSAANLTIEGASLGVLIISGAAGAPTRYALVANGGTNTLNGIPGLSLSASGLSVKINNLGQDPT
ncbi:MAG: beta strand repeat-containing protein, partial [Verrucomicrobiota bacterium]